jgi:hypothetical protein
MSDSFIASAVEVLWYVAVFLTGVLTGLLLAIVKVVSGWNKAVRNARR